MGWRLIGISQPMKKLNSTITAIMMLSMLIAPTAAVHAETHGLSSFTHPENEALDHEAKPNELGLFNRQERKIKDHTLVQKEGKVLAVSSISITIAQFGKDTEDVPTVKEYTFAIDSNTKVIRKFKGLSNIGEVSVGDKVKVYADKLTDGTAKLIWDKSIWWARLRGAVADLNTTDLTFNLLLTRQDGHHTKTWSAKVRATSLTQVVKADGTVGSFADVSNGQKMSVKGAWDNVTKSLLARLMTILP